MIGAMQVFEPIPTRGEIFDPRIHEAVEVANAREAEDGRILQELQRGYTLGNQANCRQGGELSWWTWSGSNRRPLPCHGSALPAAPQAHSAGDNFYIVSGDSRFVKPSVSFPIPSNPKL